MAIQQQKKVSDPASDVCVLYTMSGQENLIGDILYKTILEPAASAHANGPDREVLFSPTVQYHMRIRQKDRIIEKKLYPGYLFIHTESPIDFYNRLIKTRFFANFGKYLRVLRNDLPGNTPIYGGSSNQQNELNDSALGKYHDFLGTISAEEERTVLGLCGMELDEKGRIVYRNKRVLSPCDVDILRLAGVDPQGFKRNHGGQCDDNAQSNKNASDFSVNMSYGVKVVRRGSHPGHRQPGDVRTVVFDGPLQGMEGSIVRVDEHKRIAVLRTTLMHRTMDVEVPLSVVRTVEK